MDWINIDEALPPHMAPVAIKENWFSRNGEDDESRYIIRCNVLYNRGKNVWLVKSPTGYGEYVEHNGKNIKLWALMPRPLDVD